MEAGSHRHVSELILQNFTLRTGWDMLEHIVISLRFGIASSLCPSYAGPLVFSVLLPHRLQPKKRLCPRSRSLLGSFSAQGAVLPDTATSSIKFAKKSSSKLGMVSSTFCIWHNISPGGVVPGRRSNVLPSDRHERNEMVGAARNTSINRTINRPRDNTEDASSVNFTFKLMPSSWM